MNFSLVSCPVRKTVAAIKSAASEFDMLLAEHELEHLGRALCLVGAAVVRAQIQVDYETYDCDCLAL